MLFLRGIYSLLFSIWLVKDGWKESQFESTNATFIALVPEKSQTNIISHFKTINLVTSLYKIIAEVLLGRL